MLSIVGSSSQAVSRSRSSGQAGVWEGYASRLGEQRMYPVRTDTRQHDVVVVVPDVLLRTLLLHYLKRAGILARASTRLDRGDDLDATVLIVDLDEAPVHALPAVRMTPIVGITSRLDLCLIESDGCFQIEKPCQCDDVISIVSELLRQRSDIPDRSGRPSVLT